MAMFIKLVALCALTLGPVAVTMAQQQNVYNLGGCCLVGLERRTLGLRVP